MAGRLAAAPTLHPAKSIVIFSPPLSTTGIDILESTFDPTPHFADVMTEITTAFFSGFLPLNFKSPES